MGDTSQFAIDNSQRYDVISRTYCDMIEITEAYDSDTPPTADMIQYMPNNATNGQPIPQGTTAVFRKGSHKGQSFVSGEVVGSIQTVTGSITVAQKET